jgi:1-acyl-sn-glycerol-3-phosphate acyltransferase
VGTHSGAPLLPDVWPLLAKWWDLFPLEQPSHALVHDAAFKVPIVRNFLIKLGALRASRENAEKVLERDGVLLIFPGGDVEALRSFRGRNQVDLHKRTGVARLALRHGVPVLPVVNVGGHESYVVLFSGRRLARWTGLDRLTRVKALPVIAGLPWGVWPSGFVPYLPFPTKISYKAGAPMEFPLAPWLQDNPDALGRATRELQDRMQVLMSDLEERRRLPVVG